MATESIERLTDIPSVDDAPQAKFEYTGIPTTCDGAESVVWVETRISQGCGAFPITSSTTMGGGFNQAVANGVPNLWGDQLVFVEPESEHSSASFCEGFAAAGGRVTNFTSGQGLVLMKEVLYTIAGNLARSEYRKRKRRRLYSLQSVNRDDEEYEVEIPDETFSPDTHTESTIQDRHIQEALGQIPEEFREVVVLRDVQQLAYEEIAEITGLPMGTVKSRINRGRTKLQGLLKDVYTPSSN